MPVVEGHPGLSRAAEILLSGAERRANASLDASALRAAGKTNPRSVPDHARRPTPQLITVDVSARGMR